MKAVENNEEVRHVLEEFEDEMTCPMYVSYTAFEAILDILMIIPRCCDIL